MALPSNIQRFIDEQAERTDKRYDDLRAIVFNGTLKRSPEVSNTDGLVAIVRGIFERVGVEFEEIRTVDRDIPPGMRPDMRGHGYDSDEFPDIYRNSVIPANIMIMAGPIWLGDQSSLTRKVIERLYAYSGEVNEAGQWAYYGKVGAAIASGNDDGGKHVCAQLLYDLQHIGLTIPPQGDSYWTGEAGPGPSYLDAVGGGEHNAWATRNTVFLAWNVLHLARMLTDAGGIPAYGNSTHDWDLDHPDQPNPEPRES
jgi:multimeric flavodoxin WrbA